ncbi:hypothetical protein N7527_009157 [Penicillium freii]|nr:hypothetical protein N7527_009157 [Penicillium freii]
MARVASSTEEVDEVAKGSGWAWVGSGRQSSRQLTPLYLARKAQPLATGDWPKINPTELF